MTRLDSVDEIVQSVLFLAGYRPNFTH